MNYRQTEKTLSSHVLNNATRLVAHLRNQLTETYPNDLSPILYQADWDPLFEALETAGELPKDFSLWNDREKESWARQKGFEPPYQEALEHWNVTPWLAGQLKSRGEMVSKIVGFYLWGRKTSGQSVFLDDVMSEIAQESWSKDRSSPQSIGGSR